MHEFGIAQGLLDVVLTKVQENHASAVESIKLEIGVLSGIEEEALSFAFSTLSEGTKAEKAELLIDKIPLSCYCEACDSNFDCSKLAYECPVCGKVSAEIVRGKEMNLVSMEVN